MSGIIRPYVAGDCSLRRLLTVLKVPSCDKTKRRPSRFFIVQQNGRMLQWRMWSGSKSSSAAKALELKKDSAVTCVWTKIKAHNLNVCNVSDAAEGNEFVLRLLEDRKPTDNPWVVRRAESFLNTSTIETLWEFWFQYMLNWLDPKFAECGSWLYLPSDSPMPNSSDLHANSLKIHASRPKYHAVHPEAFTGIFWNSPRGLGC